MAVCVELTNVTSHKPAITGESSLRLLIVVPVAFRHRRTANPDLALWWIVCRVITSICEVDELDFNAAWDVSQSLRVPGKGVLYSTHGGRFCQPIASDHWAHGHADEAKGVFSDRTAAVQGYAYSAASGFSKLLEDDCIQESCSRKTSR